jgi:hypothetical protein
MIKKNLIFLCFIFYSLSSAAQVDFGKSIILASPADTARQIYGHSSLYDSTSAVTVRALLGSEFFILDYNRSGDTIIFLTEHSAQQITYGRRILFQLKEPVEGQIFCRYNEITGRLQTGKRDTMLFSRIITGSVLELLFTDNIFMINNNNFGTECRTGFSNVDDQYCIQSTFNPPALLFNAIAHCQSIGARLCTMAEWHNACFKLSESNSFPVNHYEWLADAVNSNNQSKLAGGAANCTNGYVGNAGSNNYRFRCCSIK